MPKYHHHLLLSFLLAVILSISGCNGFDTPVSATPTPIMTNFEKLTAMREETGVTKEFALAQFVAFFGELESAPEYSYDGSMPIFATHALFEILNFEDELASETMSEIIKRILPNSTRSNDNKITGNNGTLSSTLQVNGIDENYQTLAREISVELGNRFNRPIQKEIEVARASSADFGLTNKTRAIAYMLPLQGKLGSYGITLNDIPFESEDTCWLVINENEEASLPFDNLSEIEREMVIAHEVTHCFQDEMMSLEYLSNSSWIIEGTAAWVGEAYVGGSGLFQNIWANYETPIYKMFSQSYSAIGFWSHVAQVPEVDFWTILPTIFDSTTGISNQDLNTVIDLIGIDAYSSWPAGRARQPSWGPAWHSIGIGGRTDSVVPGLFTRKEKGILSGETELLMLNPKAIENRPTILEIKTNSHGRIRWDTPETEVILSGPNVGTETINICVSKEECVCENGSLLEGYEKVLDNRKTQSLIIAIASAESETTFNHEYIDVLANCPADTLLPMQPDQPIGTNNDPCMVGQWGLDLADLNSQASGSGIYAGNQTLTLNANGIGREAVSITFTGMRIVGTEQQIIKTTNNGNIDFRWSTNGADYIIEDSMFDIVVKTTTTINGVVGPETTAPPGDFGNEIVERKYECSTNLLLLTFPGVNAPAVRYTR